MKAKDVVELSIESLGMEGEGIAHANGFTFFVPYALPGEKIKVAVDRVKGRIVFAHIIKMLSSSNQRRDPDCPLFGKCGGCALRHLPYKDQLALKEANVRALFHKNAGIDLSDLGVTFDAQDGYRNKVALPFGVQEGKPVLGMYKKGTHKVLPLKACPLHGAWIKQLVACVLCFCQRHSLSVYDEGTGKGLLRHLVARRLPVGEKVEYGVILVINGNKLPYEEELADLLIKALDGKVSLYLCQNTMRNNVILTPKIRTICGKDHLCASLSGGVWEVSPLAFLQVNFPVAEKIYDAVVQAIPEGATVVDAYSGTGIMSALIGKMAAKVIGIETIEDAVRDANANAARFGVSEKVKHLCGETETLLPDLASTLGAYVLVVDPPRAGLDPKVVETILACPPERILYVSCSPATLTRDVAALKEKFVVDEIKLFDMFPQTPHLEVFVSMSACGTEG